MAADTSADPWSVSNSDPWNTSGATDGRPGDVSEPNTKKIMRKIEVELGASPMGARVWGRHECLSS